MTSDSRSPSPPAPLTYHLHPNGSRGDDNHANKIAHSPYIISTPPTPNGEGERSDNGRSGDLLSFTPRRAMASFENLVAMANHQERLKEARKMVWRDRGQPVVQVDTLEQCLRHAMAGGFSQSFLFLS
jgi:hypothetical protein